MVRRLKQSIIHGSRVYTPESENVPDGVFRREDELTGVQTRSEVTLSPDEGQPSGTEPFDGYEDMNVDEVVERLEGASDEERAAVREYEESHKARKGVLGALEKYAENQRAS